MGFTVASMTDIRTANQAYGNLMEGLATAYTSAQKSTIPGAIADVAGVMPNQSLPRTPDNGPSGSRLG